MAQRQLDVPRNLEIVRPPNDALGGDASKVDSVPPCPGDVCASVLRIVRHDVAEPRVGQVGVAQIGVPQIAAGEADAAKGRAPQVGATEVTQLERVPIEGAVPKIATDERLPRRAGRGAHSRTVAWSPIAEPTVSVHSLAGHPVAQDRRSART